MLQAGPVVTVVLSAAGEMRLFVCNNDDTIKVFSLPSMTNVCTIR